MARASKSDVGILLRSAFARLKQAEVARSKASTSSSSGAQAHALASSPFFEPAQSVDLLPNSDSKSGVDALTTSPFQYVQIKLESTSVGSLVQVRKLARALFFFLRALISDS
jgi:hypothetical protein